MHLFGRNFGIRNARKSIKPSKDSYRSLASNKNSSQKIANGVGVQGLMTSSKCKQISILPSCQHQQKTRHPKLTIFLF